MKRWASEGLKVLVVRCHGCPVHCWVGGPVDAPCVALLHGALLDHNAFDAQLGPLLKQYRVFLWDCPGHGQSRPVGDSINMELLAEDLWTALEVAGVHDVAIVGHSAGGFITQFAHMARPHRVWAMLLASTSSVALPYSKSTIQGMRLTPQILRWMPWKMTVRLIAARVANSENAQRYTQETAEKIGKQGFFEIWKPISDALTESGRSAAPPAPSLLVLGEQDKAGTLRSQMPRWAASCPSKRLIVIPDAGHNVMQDNPRTFNDEMLGFLDSHRPA